MGLTKTQTSNSKKRLLIYESGLVLEIRFHGNVDILHEVYKYDEPLDTQYLCVMEGSDYTYITDDRSFKVKVKGKDNLSYKVYKR